MIVIDKDWERVTKEDTATFIERASLLDDLVWRKYRIKPDTIWRLAYLIGGIGLLCILHFS